jgi:aminoglycoside 6'-N-acetyltransferase I
VTRLAIAGRLGDDRNVITIRRVTDDDFAEWLRMRMALWPDGERSDHEVEMRDFLARGSDAAVLVAARDAGGLGGFVEVALRDWLEGLRGECGGYLDGWYVDPDLRRQNVGRRLVDAAEEWTLARGLTELASDAEIDNATSIAAHHALGFAETARIVTFRKRLV